MINKGNLEKALVELKNDSNNAVSHVYENAQINEGALSGVVVTVKDNFATKDAKTQGSTKLLEGFEPNYDATVVAKLREAGASIVAKTHLDELAMGGRGLYSAWGVTVNPLDPTRIVGGSSSGAAATLTDSIGIALGSDTGDSVRLPASYVGKVGYKPSNGAVSRFGLYAFASSLDTVGWISHNVSDSIEFANVMFGKDNLDMSAREVEKPVNELVKPSSVAMIANYKEVLSEDLQKSYEDLKVELENDGVKVNMVELDPTLLTAIDIVYAIIAYSESSTENARLNGVAYGQRSEGDSWDEIITNTRSVGFGDVVQRRFTIGANALSVENQKEWFVKAQKVRRLIVEMFNEVYETNDILIFPSADIAPKLDEQKPDNWMSSWLGNANFGGQPSISIPWTKKEGMPVGMEVTGKLYNDKAVLSNALYIEKLIGGNNE